MIALRRDLPPSNRLFADVSDYQARYDARSYRRAGHRFVAIKAGEGGTSDATVGCEHYPARVHASHAARLKVGHYWFVHPWAHEARTVAELIIARTHPLYANGDRTIIDVEVGDPRAAVEWCRPLVRELHAEGRKAVIGYTYADYLLEAPQLADTFDALWIATYDGTVLRRLPTNPGRALLIAKQYTDGQAGSQPHRFAGIGPCDGSAITRRGAQWLGV